jgi:glycosyltransferase involved in cell wall biosynthesis
VLVAVHSAKRQGAQLVALGQAESLAVDHELVIAVGDGPLRAEFERVGSLIRAPSRVPIWGATRRRWALELARAVPDAIRLAIVARRRGVDAIVANSTVLIAPVLAARIARVPVIVCAHEAPTSRAARRLFRFHGALAHTVIAISPWVADAFRSSRARVVVCPVGISIPPWRDRPVRRAELPVRLLVAGTIDCHKRHDVAIAAVAKLRDAGVDAELEILGPETDHAFTAELRRLARGLGVDGRVHFAGESDTVIDHMRAADVVLVPAGEVTPLVLMEAMAVGTPVVAARMGSIPDVVVDQESGILVEPGDDEAMALAIRQLVNDPDLGPRLAIAGRERVVTRFDRSLCNHALRAELERLLART